MTQDKVYVVMCTSYTPGVDQGYISIHRVFTTLAAAEACRDRLTERWGKGGYSPQFEVETHDMLAEDHPSPDGWS
jgi:hypothetical protein